MAKTNQYGLSRDIPAPTKRQVRQQSGFGCVACGCAIYQYEHVSPPFADAKQHDPKGIALLCGGCHDRKTKGLLSTESVLRAMADPKCLSQGHSFGPFDLGVDHPEILAGTYHAIETRIAVQVFGRPILSVEPPEESGGPFQLSAVLCDDQGQTVMEIERNEWRTPVENWDVEVTGRRIICRRAHRDVTLRLRSEPPRLLVVESLSMFYKGFRIVCREDDHMTAVGPTGQFFQTQEMIVRGCEVGIDLFPTGFILGRGGSVYIGHATGGQLPPHPPPR
jgi:hypothetical protein